MPNPMYGQGFNIPKASSSRRGGRPAGVLGFLSNLAGVQLEHQLNKELITHGANEKIRTQDEAMKNINKRSKEYTDLHELDAANDLLKYGPGGVEHQAKGLANRSKKDMTPNPTPPTPTPTDTNPTPQPIETNPTPALPENPVTPTPTKRTRKSGPRQPTLPGLSTRSIKKFSSPKLSEGNE